MTEQGAPADGARLRVAYMVGTFPALTETFVLREVGALRRRGIDIVVLAVHRPSGTQIAAGALGADVTCLYARPDSLVRHALANFGCLLRRPRRYLTALRTFMAHAAALRPREAAQLLFHFFAGVGFDRDLRRFGVTHLHCHFSSATNMALAASMVGSVSFSFTAHASDDLFARPVLLDEKVARARFVIAVCDYSRRFLDSITAFRFSHKLHRIYNGVALGEVERLSATTRSASNGRPPNGAQRRIVSVGSLVAMKGHATLIQVCARLKEQGRSFRCRIIGQGPERPTLERLISTHDLQSHVELLGPLPLDKVYAELLEADVFAFLAEIGPGGSRDGFPTVILEAMAAGLPVLSTSLVGIPEMVLDGVTGVLVPERNVDAASLGLEHLLESTELCRVMGLAGQARVRELFDLDRSADELAGLLRQTSPATGGAAT